MREFYSVHQLEKENWKYAHDHGKHITVPDIQVELLFIIQNNGYSSGAESL